MNELPYANIPAPPAEMNGAAFLTRLIDGLGFRFRWATEGMSDADAAFQPAPESMSTVRLCKHLCLLANMIDGAIGGEFEADLHKSEDFQELRGRFLHKLVRIRARAAAMTDAELSAAKVRHPAKGDFPVWNLISGPLADALTHVGQINGWRRMAGNPAPKTNIFEGIGGDS